MRGSGKPPGRNRQCFGQIRQCPGQIRQCHSWPSYVEDAAVGPAQDPMSVNRLTAGWCGDMPYSMVIDARLLRRPRLAVAALAALGLLAVPAAVPAAAAPGSDAGKSTSTSTSGTVVRTDKGVVRGLAHDDVVEYSGIPYAAPPVGGLRWRPPQLAAAWPGIRDATVPGPDCAQPETAFRPGRPASESEDCLYLNVWRPAPAPRPLPVIVWLHGGSYLYGAGRDYTPRDMAVDGRTVVVTVNYRLGAFGFLAHEALNAESADGSSGAYAIQDQHAALQWVRRNAAAFGGDPRNVTLAGWSAGGSSACAHMVSPPSRGLFHKVISQSGAAGAGGCFIQAAEAAAAEGQAFADALGCGDATGAAACLRGTPVAELLTAEVSRSWGPALGGRTLPLDPVTAFATGRFSRVPVLTGTTSDEATIFVYGGTDAIGQPLTAEAYEATVRGAFGDLADAVLAEYPVAAYPHPASALSAVQTDLSFSCRQRQWNRVIAPQVPTYGYEFADPDVPIELIVEASFPLGAFHMADILYLWGIFNPVGERSPAQDRLADRMIDYWSTFAHRGVPEAKDAAGGVRFPRYDARERLLRLHPEGDTVDTTFGTVHKCDFWDSLTRS
jgi:para-nitrobenzyl esterase